ncbi:MAG: MgtC/SapB family protein, partial [Candidatus Omnitrophica bacterium]|nr:MgtC/SapB family protein [Candidatus Omnitrophota bacterium]
MLTSYSIFIRLLLAVLLGGLVGIERQLHRRTAGLRTHILVSLGSCLIMLTSIYVFDIFRGITNVDPARIAAGVITGIGF